MWKNTKGIEICQEDVNGPVDDLWFESMKKHVNPILFDADLQIAEEETETTKGGKGSGFFGHSGRPGKVGGSSAGIQAGRMRIGEDGRPIQPRRIRKIRQEIALMAKNYGSAFNFKAKTLDSAIKIGLDRDSLQTNINDVAYRLTENQRQIVANKREIELIKSGKGRADMLSSLEKENADLSASADIYRTFLKEQDEKLRDLGNDYDVARKIDDSAREQMDYAKKDYLYMDGVDEAMSYLQGEGLRVIGRVNEAPSYSAYKQALSDRDRAQKEVDDFRAQLENLNEGERASIPGIFTEYPMRLIDLSLAEDAVTDQENNVFNEIGLGPLITQARSGKPEIGAEIRNVDTLAYNFSAYFGDNPAFANALDRKIALKMSYSSRASEKDFEIYVTFQNFSQNDGSLDEKTFLHESGHLIEEVDPLIHEKCVAFLKKRTEGDGFSVPLGNLLPGQGYGPDERTKKDKFIHPYMGKQYLKNAGYGMNVDREHYATEILSMGMSYLSTHPLELMTKDPEYFSFIYAVLRVSSGS